MGTVLGQVRCGVSRTELISVNRPNVNHEIRLSKKVLLDTIYAVEAMPEFD